MQLLLLHCPYSARALIHTKISGAYVKVTESQVMGTKNMEILQFVCFHSARLLAGPKVVP